MFKFTPTEIKDMAHELGEKIKSKQEQHENFWISHLCQRMIRSIKDSGISLNNSSFDYFSDKLKEELHWQDISDDDISLFFSVMANRKIAVDYFKQDEYDCFENYTIHKDGLKVSVTYGQGCLIVIQAL